MPPLERNDFAQMTGAQIAAWCAANRSMVVIEYTQGPDGFVHAFFRVHPEIPNVDLPALLRLQAE